VAGELIATYGLNPISPSDPTIGEQQLRLEVWKKWGVESYSVKVWRLESYRFMPSFGGNQEGADVQVLVVDDFLTMKLEALVAASAADAVNGALEWMRDWFDAG